VVLSLRSPNSSLSSSSSYIPTAHSVFPRALWVAARLMQAPPPQGFPARVGVALPCSRRRRVSSSKIANKNKCIFSHGPTILIFPLHWRFVFTGYNHTYLLTLLKLHGLSPSGSKLLACFRVFSWGTSRRVGDCYSSDRRRRINSPLRRQSPRSASIKLRNLNILGQTTQ